MELRRAWRVLVVGMPVAVAASRWLGNAHEESGPDRSTIVQPAIHSYGRAAETRSASLALPDLRLSGLSRTAGPTALDAFAVQSWNPPAAPVVRAEIAAPPAPPLPDMPRAAPVPFRFVGMMATGDDVVVFLAGTNREFAARVGDIIDGAYRVENVSPSLIEFTDLKQDLRQFIEIESQGLAETQLSRVGTQPSTGQQEGSVPAGVNRISGRAPQGDRATSLVEAIPVRPSTELSMVAPASAKLGTEFTVRLVVPEGVATLGGGYVELNYHPALLAPQGAVPREGGYLRVSAASLEKGHNVSFRVIGDTPTATEVAVFGLQLTDAHGVTIPMMAPPPMKVLLVR